MIHSRKAPSPRGFTLVELMVSILIVAVLAAIVFAVSRSVMTKARIVNCTNNLRQISLGLSGHNAEFQRYPGRESNRAWDRAILPYLGYGGSESLVGQAPLTQAEWPQLQQTATLFCCPNDRRERDPGLFKRSYAIIPWTTNWSNGTAFRGWKDRPFNVGVPVNIVRRPARAAVIVEWHSGVDDGVANHLGSGGHAYHDRGGPDGADDEVHGKKQIVLFADGHTEVLPFMSNAEFVENYWPGELGNTN